MRKVLVTGGAGFIGSHLTMALLEAGHEVRVIDDMSNGLESNVALFEQQVQFIRGSITDLDLLKEAAAGVDTIFHLAAVSNVQQTLEQPAQAHAVNATGTLHVLETARANGAHVVYSSSAAVYGDTAGIPKTEDGPTVPLSPYGTQKLFGEQLLRNYGDLFGVTGVALRYFNVYGPRQRPDSPYSGVISVFVDRARGNRDIVIHGDGKQTRDFVSVHDVVQANLLAMEYRRVCHLAFNVCTGSSVNINKLAETVIEATGASSKVSHGDAREGDIQKSCGNPRRISSLMQYDVSVPFADGIKELVANG